MNLADAAVVLVGILAAIRGWRLGFLGQAFELGGGFIGLLLGLALAPAIAGAATEGAGVEGVAISLVVIFVALSIGQTIGYLIGRRFGTIARRARLGGWDSGFGVAFGIVVTLITYWLVGSLLVQGPSQEVARTLRHSTFLRALNRVSDPPDLLARVRQYLDTSGFPQVFIGLPRPIGPPVRLPSEPQARRAIEAADQSTVRIVVRACDSTQLGSGWVADRGVVVTNAHVVAGGSEVSVEDSVGAHPATVVVFDPDTDVAVLRVDALDVPALALTTQPFDRGQPGATLGYPGARGGELVVRRAAVQGRFEAIGRDIYGEDRVNREVYELRAGISQGDSGGPFVLPSGVVAGVVFAASTTDGDTGYALTGAEVEDEIQAGRTRTGAVDTGTCTR